MIQRYIMVHDKCRIDPLLVQSPRRIITLKYLTVLNAFTEKRELPRDHYVQLRLRHCTPVEHRDPVDAMDSRRFFPAGGRIYRQGQLNEQQRDL